jgi:hypothetical protein
MRTCRRYPSGRIEFTVNKDGDKFVFPLDTFPEEWVTG